ncbi:TIGR01777 family oxidoreductase [Microbacterium sp. cf332]|uniref:TIGR01777 family oxidoreductase n=1 Tax=Microbacterium sp. cf332 TaxID=1761804 RepID=UPI000882C55D|nr:TIGR01777 family oxidoreductase [Microbacterium sp. cf332]SDQ21175.1 hypothetical protein SAMN04487847_0904 [Microbacterium sp. cf332]
MADQGSTSRVVVAGASGLIGRALVDDLRADGVEVVRLVRRAPSAADEVQWWPGERPLDPTVLAGARAVVGLNGASIGRFPWTRSYKHELVWSRLLPTETLATAVRALGRDAPVFLSSSAVGYYPTRPGVRMNETAPRGDTFLADLCGEWEAAALSAREHARVVLLRTAPIVHPEGVLKPLMLLTRAGLSGPIGRGTQVWPWISLVDEVAAIRHLIEADVTGPVNLTGPTRATANDLGFALAMRMNRPYLVRAPEFALRLVLGRDATEALLTNDTDVAPAVLEKSGFTFTHERVEDAIRAVVPPR